MGQSSSQVAPTQVPPSASKSWLPSPFSQREAPPKKPGKRVRAEDSEEEAAPAPKKTKRNERGSPKEHKANRAIPQHRRGTSIKPRDSTAALDKVDGKSEQYASDSIIVAQSPSAAGESKPNAPVQNMSSTAKRKKTNVEKGSTKVAELGASVEPKQPQGTVDKESLNGTVVIDSSKPAPRTERKKKQKGSHEDDSSQPQNAAREESVPDVAALNESVSPGDAEMDGVSISVIDKSGPKPKETKEKKKRKKVEIGPDVEFDSSMQASVPVEPIELPVEQNKTSHDIVDPAPPKKKKKPSTAAQTSEPTQTNHDSQSGLPAIDSESLIENSVTDPAPKRSTKKSKKESLTDAASEVENKEPRKRKRSGPVNTSTMAEEGSYGPQAMRQFQNQERGTVTGYWTQEETDLADKIFKDFCQDNGISEFELKLKTPDWAHAGAIKVKLYEAFPGRTITNIRRHCQRKFSPYTKGQWSEEETQLLKDAYAKHPEEWPTIAKEVERDVQACRDHWKNQVKYEETMDRGAWTISEEAKLVKIVEEAVALIIGATSDPEIIGDPAKAESLISWDEIAAKMSGKRNQKRCFEKWRILKRRTKIPRVLKEIPIISGSNAQIEAAPQSESNAQEEAPPLSSGNAQGNEQKRSKKQIWLDKEMAKMSPGDCYDALYELIRALTLMPLAEFREESTLWSMVATLRDKSSRFPTTSLIRRNYLTALKTYNCKAVRSATTHNMKVYNLVVKMRKLAEKGKLDIGQRTYVAREPRKPTTTKVKKSTSTSDGKVIDSDNETEATANAKQNATNENNAGGEVIITETQSQQAVAGAEEASEADVNGLDHESLRSGTPYLAPEDFMEKCKTAGKKQHRAYLKGYGR